MKKKEEKCQHREHIHYQKKKQKIVNNDIRIYDNLCSKYFKQPNMGNYV